MPRAELEHLELLSEIDSLSDALKRWADAAPQWPAAQTSRALVRRLLERVRGMRTRLDAPLVVATLGGTGVGKGALVNALAGAEVVEAGRSRPTTLKPTLACRTDIDPQLLGIDPEIVRLVQRNLPNLANLVLLDCPDPDTTEETGTGGTNLARLRQILPHCDVLLVATTQQKYRSARVAEELAAAASGARLVFVQTHGDQDQDIRDDWCKALEPRYNAGHIFFVDSLAALADAQNGLAPRGEFAGLVDLLTRQLSGAAAAARIRRANLLDLVDDALVTCGRRMDDAMPTIGRLREAIDQQRASLAARLAAQMGAEILAGRRQWENRLLGQIASRWGFSPFALVLRVYQGLGGLVSGAFLLRVRTPAQLALWGAVEGARRWQGQRSRRQAETGAVRAVGGVWEPGQLRSSALVLEGFALEAGIDREAASLEQIVAEAGQAGQDFIAGVGSELESLLGTIAQRHTGWFTRWRYEFLFLAMFGVLLWRPAKNFFYDSWLAANREPLLGLDFYVQSAFWFLVGCLLLLWSLTSRLRRGLRREIDRIVEAWNRPASAEGVFAHLESACRRAEQFRQELDRLRQHVAGLRSRLVIGVESVGHQTREIGAK